MPKPYPAEFREDVVRVARRRETSLVQIAKDFGISDATLSNWLKKADIEDGVKPGVTEAQAEEVRELKKRNRTLEQENEILRRPAPTSPRSCPQNDVPAGPRPCRRRVSRGVTCRVLGFSTQAFNKWRRDPVSQRDWTRRT